MNKSCRQCKFEAPKRAGAVITFLSFLIVSTIFASGSERSIMSSGFLPGFRLRLVLPSSTKQSELLLSLSSSCEPLPSGAIVYSKC